VKRALGWLAVQIGWGLVYAVVLVVVVMVALFVVGASSR
jgi:hypothetical protein